MIKRTRDIAQSAVGGRILLVSSGKALISRSDRNTTQANTKHHCLSTLATKVDLSDTTKLPTVRASILLQTRGPAIEKSQNQTAQLQSWFSWSPGLEKLAKDYELSAYGLFADRHCYHLRIPPVISQSLLLTPMCWSFKGALLSSWPRIGYQYQSVTSRLLNLLRLDTLPWQKDY